MNREKKCYFLTTRNVEAIKIAFGWLFKNCTGKSYAIVAVPEKESLRGIISNATGDQFVNALRANGNIYVRDISVDILLMTERKEVPKI